MTAEALMDLRKRVDETLVKRRADIERQLERMGGGIAVVGGRGRGTALKGKKVPPKYRSPSGETWAGRGAKSRWLVAARRAAGIRIFLTRDGVPMTARLGEQGFLIPTHLIGGSLPSARKS
jgi:DNA-binding protein H-NS